MKKELVISGIIALVLFVVVATGVYVGGLLGSGENLGGAANVRFTSASVINGSSTPGTNGAIIITSASSTGEWFRITKISAADGYCGLAAATSSIAGSVGVAFITTTSTGIRADTWEANNVGGAVSCMGSAGFAVAFSFVGK
jgi:hypothetical protein